MRKIALSHTRDPAEIPFGEHGAEYVCLDMTLSIIKSEKHTCRLCSVISPDVFDIESIEFDGCLIKHCLLSIRLFWSSYSQDRCESTGVFLTTEKVKGHLKAGHAVQGCST